MLPTLVTLIAMWLAIMRQPDTPIAKAVWRLTVTAPIEWAGRFQPHHFYLALTISVATLLAVYWIGRESAQLLAMGAPDIVAWFVTFEVSTYTEALTAVAIAASTLRVKAVWARTVTWMSLRRPAPTKRQPKTRRRTARGGAPSNDDDERWSYAA